MKSDEKDAVKERGTLWNLPFIFDEISAIEC